MALFTGIDLFSYNVSNWEAAKKFYGETLELPVAWFLNDEVGWIQYGQEGKAQIAINRWNGPGPMPTGDAGGTVIFTVQDAHKTVEELRRREVRCEDAIAIPGMVTYANFYDPDGNKLQIAGPAPA